MPKQINERKTISTKIFYSILLSVMNMGQLKHNMVLSMIRILRQKTNTFLTKIT